MSVTLVKLITLLEMTSSFLEQSKIKELEFKKTLQSFLYSANFKGKLFCNQFKCSSSAEKLMTNFYSPLTVRIDWQEHVHSFHISSAYLAPHDTTSSKLVFKLLPQSTDLNVFRIAQLFRQHVTAEWPWFQGLLKNESGSCSGVWQICSRKHVRTSLLTSLKQSYHVFRAELLNLDLKYINIHAWCFYFMSTKGFISCGWYIIPLKIK